MSTETASIIYQCHDGIADVCLNRPGALNAMNLEMATEFRDIMKRIAVDESVRVILLRGTGRAFMAGGDLKSFHDADNRKQAALTLLEPLHEGIALLSDAPQPVIACLHGAVAGAGMSLAMCADIAVAEEGAVFTMAYAKVGNNPDCSGSWALPRIVGMRKALELALLSDKISVEEAKELGLVNRLTPTGEHEAVAREMAQRIAASAPAAMKHTKALLRTSFDRTLNEQLDAEATAFASNADSDDFAEALDAFFERRTPVFTGK
ncbi:MAG: enoyl-CoA hydratase-related protein [Pseudomonadota bacterium]